jgi:hypothetical protein
MDNQTAGVDLDKPGAHHLTPESIAATIKDLREIEDGTTSFPVENRDWRTGAGVLARIIELLARRAEPSVAAGDERAGWDAAAKALEDRAAGHDRMGNWTEADECRQCVSMLHDMKPARAAIASSAAQEGK